MVISLEEHVSSTNQVDKICQAILPKVDISANDAEYKQELRELVEQLMVHRPCEDDETVIFYNYETITKSVYY